MFISPAQPSMTTPLLNMQQLVDRCMGNLPLVERLLNKFSSRLNESVLHIQQAVDAGDTTSARLLTHRLKGEAANIGAEAIHAVASGLEQALLNNDATTIDFLNQLWTQCDRYQQNQITMPQASQPLPR